MAGSNLRALREDSGPPSREALVVGKVSDIVVAAKEVFVQEGYAAFSTRRVAVKAGISLGSLQYYFQNRQALLIATIGSLNEGYLSRYESLGREKGTTPQERLANVMDAVLGEISKPDVCRFHFQMWALAPNDAFVADLVETLYDAYRNVFFELISEINPPLAKAESVSRATLIAAQLEGAMLFTYRNGEKTREWANIARGAKAFAQMIAETPPMMPRKGK